MVDLAASDEAAVCLKLVVFRFNGAALQAPWGVSIGAVGGVIGRNPNCALCLPDHLGVISKAHCTVSLDGENFIVTDRSRNGTFLNTRERRVSQRRGSILAEGDRLFIGGYEIHAHIERPSDAEASSDRRGELERLFRSERPPAISSTSVAGDAEAYVADRARALRRWSEAVLTVIDARRTALARWGHDPAAGITLSPNPVLAATTADDLFHALLLRASAPGAPCAAADALETLLTHPAAMSAASLGPARTLMQRWAPDAVGRRCDRLFAFTSTTSNARKSRCWDLLWADFHPLGSPAPAEASPEAELAALDRIELDQIIDRESANAYRRTINDRRDRPPVVAITDPPPQLTLTIARLAGRPVRGEAGDHTEKSFRGGALSIGRSADADIRLADESAAVSRIHCEIRWEATGYRLIDRSANGTFLNSRMARVGDTGALLDDGDRILIGRYNLAVSIANGPVSCRNGSGADPRLEHALAAGAGMAPATLGDASAADMVAILLQRLRDLPVWATAFLEAQRDAARCAAQPLGFRLLERTGSPDRDGLAEGAGSPTPDDLAAAAARMEADAARDAAIGLGAVLDLAEAIDPEPLLDRLVKNTYLQRYALAFTIQQELWEFYEREYAALVDRCTSAGHDWPGWVSTLSEAGADQPG